MAECGQCVGHTQYPGNKFQNYSRSIQQNTKIKTGKTEEEEQNHKCSRG